MQLPIASESYQPSVQSLLRAVKRVRVILSRCVAEETTLDGATVYTNPARPAVRIANCAAEVSRIDAGLFDHFRQQGVPCHSLTIIDDPWPKPLSVAAEAAGFVPVKRQVLLLRALKRPTQTNASLQILPARSIYPQLGAFYRDFARKEHQCDDAAAGQVADAMIDRLDEARMDLFIARRDGKPVGSAGVVSLGNIGVIDPAYTDPDHRKQGIAATLMDAVLEHCARAQFEQVLVERGEGCYSIPLYTSLGFVPIGAFTRYVRGSTHV